MILSDARNTGEASNELLCRLRIQEIRLLQFAERTGLLQHGRLDVKLKPLEPVFVEILVQLRMHTEDVERICARYGFKLSKNEPNDAMSISPASGSTIVRSPFVDSARKKILAEADIVNAKNAWPKKLWWAVMDQDRFEALVRRIEGFIESLCNLLDAAVSDAMKLGLESLLMRVLALDSKVDNLQIVSQALGSAGSSGARGQLPQVAAAADLRVARLQNFDGEGRPIDHHGATVSSPTVRQAQQLDYLGISGLADGKITENAAGIASYAGQTVFVECVSYTQEQLLTARSQEIDSYRVDVSSRKALLKKRATNIAKFLNASVHPAFPHLECEGIAIEDQGKRFEIAFIYRLPAGHNRRITTLRTLLAGLRVPSLPSVTSRISLALKLIQAVRCIHTAGYLHRRLSSENIVFAFPNTSSEQTVSFDELYAPFVVGFGRARLQAATVSFAGDTDDLARAVYAHPRHLRGDEYEAYMDVYSLGTILTELAEWKPLTRILIDARILETDDVKKNEAGSKKMRGTHSFLTGVAEGSSGVNVAFRMGEVYARATELCLAASANASAGISETENALMILENALQELSACKV